MIELSSVHKAFGENRVLTGVDLTIGKGRTTTIIGGSGSGKSVLFKHIIGLMKPDRGEIRVDGQEITRMKESELYRVVRRFAMVFQSGALFDSLSVGENVAFGLKVEEKHALEQIDEIVTESLLQVGLPNIGSLYPAELSGGMKKRVAIARAIAKKPEIIMYDEPTTGLDPIMADVINSLILKLSRALSVTSIVITHDMTSAYKVSDKIAVLYGGKIIAEGGPDEIRNTDDPIVRQFIEGRAEGPIEVR